MQHLRYDCYGAGMAGENRHPQTVMRELGISYKKAIPQSMGGQWWLFDCQYEGLPEFIEVIEVDAWMVKQYQLPGSYINNGETK